MWYDSNRRSMIRRIRPTLALLCLAALLTLAGKAALENYLAVSQQAAPGGADAVAAWVERMKAPLRDLPADQQTIGYVCRRDFPNLTFDAASAETMFALTQFAAAPRILQEPGLNNAYILANLLDTPTEQVMGWMVGHNLKLVNDYGGGIYLFRKASP